MKRLFFVFTIFFYFNTWAADKNPLLPVETRKKAETLHQLYEAAQKDFLTKPSEEAILSYKKVVGISSPQFSNVEKRMLQNSYLRLSELDLENRRMWLEKAVQAAPLLDADPNIFSPRTLILFEKAKQDLEIAEEQSSPDQEEVVSQKIGAQNNFEQVMAQTSAAAVPTSTKPIYQNTWFWIGTAAVVTSIALFVKSQQNSSEQNQHKPTHETIE